MAGEYREILVNQFKKDGFDTLSDKIKNKDIMIAITNSIQGNVRTRKDLTETFVTALSNGESVFHNKYRNGLLNGNMIPVESFGGKTYINETYKSGELYFTT